MTVLRRYRDRAEAGRILAAALRGYAGRPEVRVLALPRGGVPVGLELARELRAPLGLCLVRKLGVPWHRELAMGAVASGGVRVLNEDVIAHLAITPEELEAVTAKEVRELARREAAYLGDRPPMAVAGCTVILVDDGVATGATLFAAIRALRASQPARLVVAVPVAPADTLARLRAEADEVVCPLVPAGFQAIGEWYDDFSQTSDEEVRAGLAEAQALSGRTPPSPP